MKKNFLSLSMLLWMLFSVSSAYAHCEMPCGIYNDEVRIQMIREDIATIEKAMIQIGDLSKDDPVNYNQLVRWVNTKEDHANKIQEVASEYFITQRLKPTDPSDKEAYDKYITQLTLMHELMVYAMKAKQTLNQEYIQKMGDTLDKFEVSYFGHKLEEGHEH